MLENNLALNTKRGQAGLNIKEWFYPQSLNNHTLISRIVITENPSDNNATLLIIFDEPLTEEYVINNKTNVDI
jgi:hypothetical protein